MHPTRRTRTTLGAMALAVALLVGLTACNPPKGQANIKASGAIRGSVQGPKVTCSSTSRINQRQWTGTLAGRQAFLGFQMNKVTGFQTVTLSYGVPGGSQAYGFSGSGIVKIDSAKVAHFDGQLGTATDGVRVTAALACP